MRGILGFLAAVVLAGGCSSGASTFALTDASVDPTYFCPGGANNVSYDLHATVHAHNGTSNAVTIRSAAGHMTLAAVTGSWLEKVGDRYDASNVKFTPSSIAAGKNADVKVIIPSACTSGAYGTGAAHSGDYTVKIDLTTSAGNFSIIAANQHEIVAT